MDFLVQRRDFWFNWQFWCKAPRGCQAASSARAVSNLVLKICQPHQVTCKGSHLHRDAAA